MVSWRRIFALAMPVAMQSLLQAFLGMADVLMVSGLGASAVAAVGLAAKLHFLLLVVMFGVSTGAGILIAQYKGAGNDDGCRRTAVVAMVFGVLAISPFVLLFFGANFWLGLINPDPEVVKLASIYLMITAPTLFMVQIVLVYESALRSVDNTFLPMVLAVVATLLNIALNAIFIFGWWGFPAMGVAGAALGTLVSRFVQVVLYQIWLKRENHTLLIDVRTARAVFERSALKKFTQFAGPIVINHCIWALGNTTYHVATGFAGTQALAVMGIMVPLESVFFAWFIGLAAALSVLIGQALGRGDMDGAWYLYRFFDRLAITLALVLGGLIYLLQPYLLTLLNIEDPEIKALFSSALVVFCCAMWVKTTNMVRILGVLRAGGDIRFCLVTDTIVMWCAGVPIFIMAIGLGAPFFVLYGLIILEDGLKFFPVWRRLYKRIWLRNLVS